MLRLHSLHFRLHIFQVQAILKVDYHFLDAIEHIYETMNTEEAKLKLKTNLQDLLSRIDND